MTRMSLDGFCATLTVLVLWTCLDPIMGWPVPENNTTSVETTRRFIKPSMVTSVSVVRKQEDEKDGGAESAGGNRPPSPTAIGINFYRLPPSPANLLKPDGFQFYTYNERGDMITKQMTVQEIQALIASGGPDHSNTGIQEPQKAEDILTGGKKVMDVVEKVQKVLKSAMGKPSQTMTDSISTVPEKANAEWSNILPAILAGDKYGDKVDESSLHHYVEAGTPTEPPSLTSVVVDLSRLNGTGTVPLGELLSENVGEPIERNDGTTRTTTTVTPEPTMSSYNTEKLMIPVAVITAAQKPQMVHRVTDSPIFQKITDIAPSESVFDEKYNNHDPATPIALPLPLDSSKNSYDSTENTDSATLDTDFASVADGYELLSTVGTNKLQTLVTNPQFTSTTTTPPLHLSATFDTSTGESSKVSPLLTESSTRPSDSDSAMQHLSRPLPNELADSLSSMMNQVAEVSVPSLILPASSGLELPDRETAVIEEKRNNSADTRTSTTLSTTSSAVPTTKLKIDRDQIFSTTSPVTLDSVESTANSDITTVDTDATWNPTTNSIISSTTSSDQTRRSSSVTVPTLRETTTPLSNPVEPLETNASSAEANSTSKPNVVVESVAIIENILETISTEANTHLTESITLPNISSGNLPTKTLASALVAGFGLSDSRPTSSVLETQSTTGLAPFSRSTTTSKLETQTSASVRSTVTETSLEHIALTTEEECYSRNENEMQGTSSTTTTTTTSGNTLAPNSRLPETNSVHVATNHTVTDQSGNVSVPAQGGGSSGYTTSSTVYETAISSDESWTVANAQDSYTTAHLKKPEDEATEAAVFETISRPERISPVALKKDDRTSIDTTTKLESPINDEATLESTKTAATTATTTYNDASINANQSTVSVVKNSNLNVTTVLVGTEASSAVGKGDTITQNGTPMVTTMKNEIKGSSNATIGTNFKGHQVITNVSSVKMSDPTVVVKVNKNATDVESVAQKWQRISLRQTTPLPSSPSASLTESTATSKKPKEPLSGELTGEGTRYQTTTTTTTTTTPLMVAEPTAVSLNASKSANGLDSSTMNASPDVVNFSKFCNELAFKFWTAANKGLSSGRSLTLSPFGMVSLLAMIFLGARGPTSDQMNEVLGLDNVATFNPHLIFQNVTDTVSLARHQGIANAAFVRELFADKAKVRKLLPFYKEQAQQFYEGLVAEVNFATISDLARRRTNLLVRKQTGGRIKDFVKSNSVPLRSPLAAISANVFQTDCNTSLASTTGRDGELYFAVSSSAHRSRKLIPVPAAVWRSNVLAGYEPSLDATAVALGGIGNLVSTIFLLPGQQGHAAPGDTLDRLEERLVRGNAASRDGAWNQLLKVLIPRPGLELQIPKFSHRSVVNATAALKRMGLDQLFSSGADFKGINGIGNRLFLSDVLQMNLFSTCGDENVANGRHHVEIYPASPSSRESRRKDVSSSSSPDSEKPAFHSATRSSERLEEKPRLKLDQPFLYFVRHNPTGLILHMGRFNPRLL
ncbi:uncharacterized protein LOC143374308 isoform X2 [Andrena cerasifolii]